MKSDTPSAQALLAAYGENDLARQGITLGSGTVKVQGSRIPAGHTVWVAGRQVPVDPQGNFAAEEIFRTARIRSKSRSLTKPAMARSISAILSSRRVTCSSSVLLT